MGRLTTALFIGIVLTSTASAILYVNLVGVLSENRLLKVEVDTYRADVLRLEYELSRYDGLLKSVEGWLEGNVSELRSLRAMYEGVIHENNQLREWLLGNVSEYEARLKEVLRKYSELLESYEGLETKLRTYVDEVESLRRKLSRAVIAVDLPYGDHRMNKEYLERSVNSLEEVRELVPNISNYGEGNIIKEVVLWISNNIYYQHDLTALKDYWKLPNETIKEEGGDCEDYAVLGYALLRRAGFKNVYVLSWNVDGSGHVGVLIYDGGGWYLVDPGWSYVNDYMLYLRAKVYADEDHPWVISIHPSHIHPMTKKLLIGRGLARYEWYDHRTNAYVDEPTVRRQTDLKGLISSWPLRGGYGVDEVKAWTLITDDETIVTSDLDEVVNALTGLTNQR